MRTRPSWEEYQRYLADERTAASAAARADELARTQFWEHTGTGHRPALRAGPSPRTEFRGRR
jgi:hypothetical protein